MWIESHQSTEVFTVLELSGLYHHKSFLPIIYVSEISFNPLNVDVFKSLPTHKHDPPQL